MIDRRLRQVKSHVLAPLVPHLRGVSPTALSLVGLVAGLGAAGAAAVGAFGWAFGLWLLNRVLDGLDGEVARAHGRSSDLGGYIDLVIDFVVYEAVPLGVAVRLDTYAPVAVLLGMYYVNAAAWMLLSQLLERRAVPRIGSGSADKAMTTVAIPAGLMEGAETVVGYMILLLFPQQFQLVTVLLTAVVAATIVQRVVWARKSLRGSTDAAFDDAMARSSTASKLEQAA